MLHVVIGQEIEKTRAKRHVCVRDGLGHRVLVLWRARSGGAVVPA
jgi:hypothetical protein